MKISEIRKFTFHIDFRVLWPAKIDHKRVLMIIDHVNYVINNISNAKIIIITELNDSSDDDILTEKMFTCEDP